MSDITLCKQEDCKLKESCKRYITKSKNSEYQSYFADDPRDKKGNCEYYWEIEIKSNENK